jgi:hypothetical protein
LLNASTRPKIAKELQIPYAPEKIEMKRFNNMMKNWHENLTRNIAKSGELLIWSDVCPFQLHLGLIENHSQSASCHIATR